MFAFLLKENTGFLADKVVQYYSSSSHCCTYTTFLATWDMKRELSTTILIPSPFSRAAEARLELWHKGTGNKETQAKTFYKTGRDWTLCCGSERVGPSACFMGTSAVVPSFRFPGKQETKTGLSYWMYKLNVTLTVKITVVMVTQVGVAMVKSFVIVQAA